MLSKSAVARGLFAFAYAAVAPARAQVTDDFSAGLAGWTASGDGLISPSAVFGNPAGSARITDLGTGEYFYFNAPAAYLGDKSSFEGGTLTFDLWTANSSADADPALPDLEFVGGGLTLVRDLPLPPSAAWSSYTARLDAADGWRLGNSSGPLASAADIRVVLADLQALRIRGEFSTASDISYIDNVSLTALPCPADLTGDGTVNFADVQALVAAFNVLDPAADLTGNGTVNFADVQAFVFAFNAGC